MNMSKANAYRFWPVICLFFWGTSAGDAQTLDFNFQLWVKTELRDTTFPMIVGNKDWDGGEVVDFTSNHNLGQARSTGVQRGWSLFLRPNGAWGWNIGDGERRLDYLPTAARQRINDGRLHFLAFTVDVAERAAWLYFDGALVAIYSLDELDLATLEIENLIHPEIPNAGFDIKVMEVRKGKLLPDQALSQWQERNPPPATKSAALKDSTAFDILAWNIWHGGRRDGNEIGLDKTVEIIRNTGAAVVCMQETYGSGPVIADRLQMVYYYRSSNLSVMTKYPILEVLGWYDPFRFGGVTLLLPTGQKMRFFSLWINHLPNLTETVAQAKTAKEIVRGEMRTRGNEIREILANVEGILGQTDSIPVVIAGDFNSPSHLDWGEATLEQHRGLQVTWPVSASMERAGFRDAYRVAHPDVAEAYGRTWSPRFTDSWQDRIDYIYFRGKSLHCLGAEMLDTHPDGWPSDHAAVLARFGLRRKL